MVEVRDGQSVFVFPDGRTAPAVSEIRSMGAPTLVCTTWRLSEDELWRRLREISLTTAERSALVPLLRTLVKWQDAPWDLCRTCRLNGHTTWILRRGRTRDCAACARRLPPWTRTRRERRSSCGLENLRPELSKLPGDDDRFRGSIIECMTSETAERTRAAMAAPGSHRTYRPTRPLVEKAPVDVWPETLEAVIDADAPRQCMYAKLGSDAPCRQPAWFLIPRNEHCPVDLWGCREHAPLMAVTGERVRRLVRPLPPVIKKSSTAS